MRFSIVLALFLVAIASIDTAQAGEGGAPTKVGINTVIGPPDQLADRLLSEFATALQRRHIAVAEDAELADFSLYLYVLAVAGKGYTTVDFVLDIKDGRDRRVCRFGGKDVARGSFRGNTFGAVTPVLTRKIAAKAASSFSAWLQAGSGTERRRMQVMRRCSTAAGAVPFFAEEHRARP
jgi:hypothetical protein